MVVIAIIIMFAVFIVGEWLFLRYEEKNKKMEQKIPHTVESNRERYYHPGHTWVELNPEDRSVLVGLDTFTSKIIGPVDKIDLPREGQIIQQGNPIWTLIRGSRRLTQVAPMTGKVVKVNSQGTSKESWLVKLSPIELRQNLNNLLKGELADKWTLWSKSQFVLKFVPNPVPVYQDGGELTDDLCKDLTDEQWDKVQKEFFYLPVRHNHSERK